MRSLGVEVDAVSAGEIVRALKAGFSPNQIRYTADIFDNNSLALVKEHSIPVNIGSADMLLQLANAGVKVPLAIRVNPGFGHGHSSKVNTGGDLSKHGIWHSQLPEIAKLAKEKGFALECLHIHIGSGTDFEHLSQVANSMEKAIEAAGSSVKIISAGGGLPIDYKGSSSFDTSAYYNIWNATRKKLETELGHSITLEVEPGRYLVAESCVLVAEIRAVKKQGENLFYLVDSGFTDLVRPAFYGAYHHISILSATTKKLANTPLVDAIVAGPLCESGDVFTQEEGGFVVSRKLPLASVGDLLLLHNAGAYGSAMSSNYNSRLLAPEILSENGELKIIRKRQTYEQLLENEIF